MPTIPTKYFTFVQLFAVLWMMWELGSTVSRQRGLLTAYVLGAVCRPSPRSCSTFARAECCGVSPREGPTPTAWG